MSASTVLSVIAPLAGAAPSPSATGDGKASADFAVMVSEAGEAAETEAVFPPVVAPAPVKTAPAKTSRAPLIADVAATPVEGGDLAEIPTPAVETEAIPPSPVPAPAPVEVEREASGDRAEAGISPAEVEKPALPAPAALPATPPSLTAAAATPPVPAAPPAPSGEEAPPPAAAPAEAPDTPEPVAAAPAGAAPAADGVEAPPQTAPQPNAAPQKGEPVRMASATRETLTPHTLVEASSGAARETPGPSPSTGSTATPSAPAQTLASTPTAPRADPAPLRPLEAVAPTIATGSPAAETATQDAPPAPVEVVASTLSRVTVETTVQIAARIVRQLEAKQTRFDMVLTPEDLGRVEVSLDIDADGQLAARLAFDNPAAAADLRGRVDELRRQLTDAGFQLAGDALEFSDRGAGAFSGGAFERGQNRAFSFAGGKRLGDQADLAVAGPAAWINLSLTPDRVDMRV